MLGEVISALRDQAVDRIKSPLLGPFFSAWLVSNWKFLVVLFGSERSVEHRIEFIQANYINSVSLFWVPFIFSIFYSVVLPWLNYLVQIIQEKANLNRRKFKLGVDTDYLTASVARAEAQANLNRILAKDQMTRDQQEQIVNLKKELSDIQKSSQELLDEKEEEIKKRREEYENIKNRDSEKAKLEKENIAKLMDQLNQERRRVRMESDRVNAELEYRRAQINQGINEAQGFSIGGSDSDLTETILSGPFRLYFNPSIGTHKSKAITFKEDGEIGEGRNHNESRWQVVNGKLELIQNDGQLHNRFMYLPKSRMFVSTGDPDIQSTSGQYIIPETKRS